MVFRQIPIKFKPFSIGQLLGPLTQHKKDYFHWKEVAEVAFQQLKRAMTEVPVLALLDFTQPFVVESDAPGSGIGAVLMQQQQPIAYFSQTLSSRAQSTPVYERELMAIVLAIQKWHHYLMGRRFVVRTDHKSLKFLLEQRLVSEEHQKWLCKLLGYDFEIQYKPGIENKAVNALSRKNLRLELMVLSSPVVLDMAALQQQVLADPKLAAIRNALL